MAGPRGRLGSGASRARTDDLPAASRTLSQLSYSPKGHQIMLDGAYTGNLVVPARPDVKVNQAAPMHERDRQQVDLGSEVQGGGSDLRLRGALGIPGSSHLRSAERTAPRLDRDLAQALWAPTRRGVLRLAVSLALDQRVDRLHDEEEDDRRDDQEGD